MPYINYNEDVEAIEGLAYVSLFNLQNMLNQLDGIQFALQTQRTQGIQIAAGIEKQYDIFGEGLQFPDTDAGRLAKYVCIQLKDWPMKFDQVISSLNYKVPDVANTNKDLSKDGTNFQSAFSQNKKTGATNDSSNDDATKCIKSQSERDVFLNAQKSFTTGVADMKQQLHESIWTRRIFERKYSLIWKKKGEEKPPEDE